jgi:Uma2 family endonuclease
MIATTARETEATPQVVRFVMDGGDGACCVNVPTAAFTLAGFRTWSSSDDFPEGGKITYIGGEIMIDMSPERLDSHMAVRSEVCRVAANIVADADLGRFYLGGTRFVHEQNGVSNEPAALFVSWAAFAAKRIRMVRTRDWRDFIEREGSPEWVLEIVSPSSVFEDTVQFRAAYHRAGVAAYWRIDARGDKVRFEILHHGPDGYLQAIKKKGGWQESKVFGKQFRLLRIKDRLGNVAYRLEVK